VKRHLLLTSLGMIAIAGPMSARGGDPSPGAAAEPAQRLDDFALLLGLRVDQHAALATMLAAAMPPPPPAGARGAAGPPLPPEGPPAGQSAPLERMERRLGDQRKRLEALRHFRDGLDEGQRQRFDALMRLSFGPRPAPPRAPGD
jgi:hypothetical protein